MGYFVLNAALCGLSPWLKIGAKNVVFCCRHPSVSEEEDMGMMVKSLAVAQQPQRQKVLTSPFAQTMEQVAPTWPPFNPQSQKYMALGIQLQGAGHESLAPV